MAGVFQHHIRYAVSFAAACVVALALCVEAKRAHGQDQTVDITEFLKQRRQELRVTDGRLDGPAAKWTLFDLRELRKPLREGKLNVEGEVGQIIAGYDALVLLKDSARAHFQP